MPEGRRAVQGCREGMSARFGGDKPARNGEFQRLVTAVDDLAADEEMKIILIPDIKDHGDGLARVP